MTKKTISASATLKILAAISLVTGFISFLIFIFAFINGTDQKLLFLWVGIMIGTFPNAIVIVWLIYYLKKPNIRSYWIITIVFSILAPVIGIFGLLSAAMIFIKRV